MSLAGPSAANAVPEVCGQGGQHIDWNVKAPHLEVIIFVSKIRTILIRVVALDAHPHPGQPHSAL